MRSIITSLIVAAFVIGCSSNSENQTDIAVRNSTLTSESDSLAYIIGMSIGEQLIKMDSSINITLVSRAIVEQFEGRAEINMEDARIEYLRYLLYVEPERKRGYEEQFLSDLALNDRKYTRTKSGLTYNIVVIGDESIQPRNNNDWITVNHSIARLNGEVVLPAEGSEQSMEQIQMALSELPSGIQESVRMLGKGGRIDAYIPSKLAYGEEGDPELGIEPIETLRYTIELTDMEKNMAQTRKRELREQREKEERELQEQLEREQQEQQEQELQENEMLEDE
ncbi:MAG: FKBP-type peptidyl-prolyl cis-trans isomerase [Rikenellaceae bacterium]